jgi:hypothetical protein
MYLMFTIHQGSYEMLLHTQCSCAHHFSDHLYPENTSNGLMACEKILSLLHSDLLGKRMFAYIHTAAFINDCVFLGLIPGRGLLTIILSRTAAS